MKKYIQVEKNQKQSLVSFQVSFMSIGNMTMFNVKVENFQIQKAVDLRRHMNCEMRLNFIVNVLVAVHRSTFQCNKKCISLSEHPVCVLYTVDIYTQKYTHGPIVSAVTLHTEMDTLRRSHK